MSDTTAVGGGKPDGKGGLVSSNNNSNSNSNNPANNFFVEYSSTGRATCRRCDAKIGKGILRVGHTPLFRGKVSVCVCVYRAVCGVVCCHKQYNTTCCISCLYLLYRYRVSVAAPFGTFPTFLTKILTNISIYRMLCVVVVVVVS
jgi:hypothetical protein